MKKVWLYFMIIGLIGLAACSSGKEAAEGSSLAKAFLASGAECSEIRLVAWEKISDHPYILADLQEEAEATARAISLDNWDITTAASAGWRQVAIDGTKENADYQIYVQAPDDGTYLIVKTTAQSGIRDFDVLKQKLLSVLGNNCEYNGLIVGCLPGRRSEKELEALFRSVLVASNGRLVNTAAEANYYSINAYLDGLDQEILVGGKEVNLQMAADYLEKENKTYLYFGLPLVYSDY